MREIPLSAPNLDIEIADNLRECIETGWVSTGGRFISAFEEKVARYVGAAGAVGCQSGTAGLHTALRILGVGPGDLVIAPTLTFIAAVNPIRYQYADPVFIGCDQDFCLDADALERYCREDCHVETEHVSQVRWIPDQVRNDSGVSPCLVDNASGRVVRAVIVVHVFGNLADMERILEITQSYHLRVLEDATEALGSFWGSGALKGKHAGTVGDIGVYSFNANKIITTGGGGMLVARREEDLRQAQYLTTTAKDDGLYFIHDEVGYNYRMLNLQAALGVSQIDKLDGFIETKKRNYELYAELLKDAPGMRLLPFKDEIRANYWFYSLLIDDEADGGYPACSRRDRVMKALISEGIQCRPVWRLCHAQKAYTECRVFDTELAHFYEKHILNIPCSTSLTEEDVRYVCGRILSLA